MRRSNLFLKNVRNKRTTVVSYIKKNAKRFLATWIQAIFLTIKHFGSRFSRFFSEKRKNPNKISLVDDSDTTVSDD